MLSKMLVCSALLAVAAADTPSPSYAPAKPAPYVPKPAPSYGHPTHGYKEEKPQPFQYQYGVKDQYTGNQFQKAESQDEYGNVQGKFVVALPDGRVQTTTYTVTHEGGFIADVAYEGTAVYPPEPKEGYGHSYKAPHHSAPAYKAPAKPAYPAKA